MVEQRVGFVWTGAGFGVPLEAERWLVSTVNSLQGTVKQGFMRCTEIGWQAGFFHSETMVLRRDHHTLRGKSLNRLAAAVMAELHRDCFGTGRQGQQLRPQANTRYGRVCCKKGLDRLNGT